MNPSSLAMYKFLAKELNSEVYAFGSRARGQERADSDLDVGIPGLNYRYPDPNHLRAIDRVQRKFNVKVDARNSMAAYRNSIIVEVE